MNYNEGQKKHKYTQQIKEERFRTKENRLLMAENARKVNKIKNPDGYIYVFQYGNQNVYKFGASNNPERRLKDVDSGPVEIKMIGKFYFKNVYEMEECIHDNLIDGVLRKEWFKIEKESVIQIMNQLKEMSEEKIFLKRI